MTPDEPEDLQASGDALWESVRQKALSECMLRPEAIPWWEAKLRKTRLQSSGPMSRLFEECNLLLIELSRLKNPRNN